jgi:molecular chaperone DnaK
MYEPVLGIDLGTTTSCVAIVDEQGQPRVLTNEWNEYTHASCISFLPDGRVLVGNEAKRRIVKDPEHTIFSSKRLIGRYYFSEEVRKARAVCPYNIVEGPNRSVLIEVYGKTYALPEVAAMVLKEVKTIAENALGREVTKAVITVPAYFNDNQRQATKDAGRIAGLDVLRMINEPTAAALAYGYGRKLNQRVVVYDLGGGTFDVSILNIAGDVFEVIGTAGDTYLGGDDFDLMIMDRALDGFLKMTGLDLRGDKNRLQRLRDAAERAKISLSRQDDAQISLKAIAQDQSGRPIDLQHRITGRDFAEMAQSFIQRTFKVTDEALASAKLGVRDIDGIILVGGPTRLPIIRQSVQMYFAKPPLTGIDPDQVVALGAAIQGQQLISGASSAMLLDVTPLTLRIGTVGGYTEAVIDRNTPLPIDRIKTFTTSRDGQDRVKIRVYQGEAKLAAENEMLGEFELAGFRAARRGEVQLEVMFEINTDGIVNISARDKETGQKASCQIELSSGLTKADVEASRARNADITLAHEREGDGGENDNLPAVAK